MAADGRWRQRVGHSSPNLHRFRTNSPRSFGVHTTKAPVMILSRRKLLISAAALALVLGVASSPQLLGAHVASAFESLRGAERHWLLVAAVGFVAAFACTVGAWRSALAAAGGRVCPKRAA